MRCERIGFLRTTCDVGLLADSASKPCDRLDDLSLAETLVVAAKHINIHRLQRIVIQRFLAERKDHSGGAVFGALAGLGLALYAQRLQRGKSGS